MTDVTPLTNAEIAADREMLAKVPNLLVRADDYLATIDALAARLAAAEAVVEAARESRDLFRDSARCWSCGALRRLPDTHDPLCLEPFLAALDALTP